MNLINNRYRIVKNLIQTGIVSTYSAADIIEGKNTLKISIINPEYVSDKLIKFYSKEFINLVSIDSPKIMKVFEFGVVDSVDSKKIKNYKYYYTTENIKNSFNVTDYIFKMNEEESIDFFIKVCEGISYLHHKNFIYSELNLNNIIGVKYSDEDNYDIKLKDLATIELEKYDYCSIKSSDIKFKAPEILTESSADVLSDIYSLGVLLLIIATKNINEHISVQEELEGIERKNIDSVKTANADNNFAVKLYNIIKKAIEQNRHLRYNSVDEMISDINIIFNKNYVLYRKEDLEKINFNTSLFGREYETKEVLNSYKTMMEYDLDKRFIFIHGEDGIGKTRFLRELKHIFRINKINVISSFAMQGGSSNTNKAIISILRKIIADCDVDLIERYQSEIVKFLPEIAEGREIITRDDLTGEKEKARLVGGIFGFLNEFLKNRPSVFMIDNIDLADDVTLEILHYMYMRNLKGQKAMVILTYSDVGYAYRKKFREFLDKLNEKSNVLDIHLRGLTEEETCKMIKNTLRMSGEPTRFSNKIYNQTYGNPLFIQEILKDLLSKGILYIDDNGVWSSLYDGDYDSLPTPHNIQQAVFNQIKQIDPVKKIILDTISIFNGAVPIEIVDEFKEDMSVDTRKESEELVSMGVLCKKIEDRGFVYDFSNRILKNLIYTRLDEEYKKIKHQVAAIILERDCMENPEDREELIYHLEKAGKIDKAIKYCIANADRMEKLKNRHEAIRYLEKAVAMSKSDIITEEQIELIIKLGDVYEDDGSMSAALKSYSEARNLSRDIQSYNYEIDCLNKMTNINIHKNNIKSAEKNIENCKRILKNHTYDKGFYELKIAEIDILCLYEKYGEAYYLCLESIGNCPKSLCLIKSKLYNKLGNVQMWTGRGEEALKSYSRSIEYCEQIGEVRQILNAINNVGACYGDYYQDNEKAISYFLRMKEISEENNILSAQILASINLAECYYYEFKYEKALKYFMEALEKSKQTEDEGNIFYCYNHITNIYLKLANYEEAYIYYKKCQKELQQYPIHGIGIAVYYYMCASLFFELGYMEEAEDYIDHTLKIYGDNYSKQLLDAKLLKECILIYREDEEILEDGGQKILSVLDQYNLTEEKVYKFYEVASALYKNGHKALARTFYDNGAKLEVGIKSHVVQARSLYLKGIMGEESGKFRVLKEALELSKRGSNENLRWKICNAIGDYYLSKKNYFHAVNYYFEACEVIKNIVIQLPEEYRVNYVNFHNSLRPFNKLMTIKDNTDYTRLLDSNVYRPKIDSNEELEELFNYENFINILSNKYFIKSAKKIYSNSLPKGIKNMQDIMANMYSDPVKTLDLVVRYIASLTLSTRALIVLDAGGGKFETIVSSNDDLEIDRCKYIFDRVKISKEPLIIAESFKEDKELIEINFMPSGIKAAMCLPIITESYGEETRISRERRRIAISANQIKGYLYIESDRVLNSINKDNLKKCIDFRSFIGFAIEKYQLKITSSIDKLTGTLTRQSLEEALSDNIGISNEMNSIFSILMFDLDHFKWINDRFGHQTGDEVLRKVCKIIKDNIRKNDVVGRFGGEEFIVILPETDLQGAAFLAEKLINIVDSKKVLGDKMPVTLSMGIAVYPQHAQWENELIEKADQALYVAKENGRNRYQIWNNEFSNKIKVTNKLTGIISGDTVQDSRNVLAMVELIELIKDDVCMEEKIYRLLGRIIEITESQYGMFATVEDGSLLKKYSRKIFEEDWIVIKNYNKHVLDTVINKKQGVCMVDWDEVIDYDSVTGIPDWQSVAAVPIIKSGEVKGVLYLSVSTKLKEFKSNEFNFINTLAELSAALF